MDSLLQGRATITYALIAVSVAISLVGFWAIQKESYKKHFVFRPNKVGKPSYWLGAVVSHFSHGDFGHLFLNMFVLFIFGPKVEAELGALPFLVLYFASGITGTLAVFIFRRKNPRHSALGASGCIAGVMFASVVIDPTSTIMLIFLPIPIPAPIFAVLYLAFSSVKMGGRDGIAHEAHIGGALAGLALAGLLFSAGFEPLIRTVSSYLA